MDSSRRTALIAGVFFIVTFITSIAAVLLYRSTVLNHPSYIVSAGADGRVALGAFLEIVLVIANIGTAVVLFPIVKRQSEGVALGYVAARVVESTIIAIGIVSLLAIVTLRKDLQGAAGAVSIGKLLVAVHDRTFLLGPGLVAGFGNGLMLGYLMYRSRLVPRAMALLGLIGGPLVFASGILVVFGLYKQFSTVSAVATLPEFAWELSLGVWLIVKGFRPSPIISRMADTTSSARLDLVA
jgi:hypothetical protein